MAGILILPKHAFALGFETPDFNYSPSNPSTLTMNTTAVGNENKGSECALAGGGDDLYRYESQLLTVADWYIGTSKDDDSAFNTGHAVDGLSGTTRPDVNSPLGESGCGTEAIMWKYTIDIPNLDISDLTHGTYYFCLKIYAAGGSPTSFARCDSFQITKVSTPGSFSLLSATGTNTSNSCSVALDWNASSNATSYAVYVHFWSTGAWQEVASGITSTDYTYDERKGVDLYYKITAVNSSGTKDSNVQATSCPLPTVTISASPSSIDYGSSSTISWTPANAFLCTASNAWSGSKTATSGTHTESTGTLYGPATKTYSIICSDADGGYESSPQSASVTVGSPPIPTVTLTSSPTSLAWDNTSGSTLTWSTTNATSCSASGDWSGSKSTSGSQGTGQLSTVKTYTYTLTCTGIGGNGNDSASVVVNPPTPTLSSLTTNASSINYCSAGPSGTTVSWSYSDPASSPQQYYQVQVTDNGSFTSPMYDSGKIESASSTASLQNASLDFDTTYKARVRAYDSLGGVSDWYQTSSWTTPPNAYPQVDFTWTPTSPGKGSSVSFDDNTIFYGSPSGHQWSWTFGDGGNSSQQNPSYTYNDFADFTVSLTATDNQDQACTIQKTITVQRPIPHIKEVAP